MLGSKKSPMNTAKHTSVDPARLAAAGSNPFDPEDELDNSQILKPSRTSSDPTLSHPNFGANPFHFIEKAKQDDALSDLSDLLGEFKGMAEDMGQNKSLSGVQDDVDVLNICVRGVNQRGRQLLGK